jgi:hypothetical protein
LMAEAQAAADALMARAGLESLRAPWA